VVQALLAADHIQVCHISRIKVKYNIYNKCNMKFECLHNICEPTWRQSGQAVPSATQAFGYFANAKQVGQSNSLRPGGDQSHPPNKKLCLRKAMAYTIPSIATDMTALGHTGVTGKLSLARCGTDSAVCTPALHACPLYFHGSVCASVTVVISRTHPQIQYFSSPMCFSPNTKQEAWAGIAQSV
jgi:hypothetical protein